MAKWIAVVAVLWATGCGEDAVPCIGIGCPGDVWDGGAADPCSGCAVRNDGLCEAHEAAGERLCEARTAACPPACVATCQAPEVGPFCRSGYPFCYEFDRGYYSDSVRCAVP